MKVILTADIKNVGQKGDEKEVKPGFARNFLFPHELAVLIDSSEAKKIIQDAEKKQEQKNKTTEKTKEKLTNIKSKDIVFERKTSKSGKLYGGISEGEIVKKIEDEIGVKPEKIFADFPLKMVGDYLVKTDFPGNKGFEIKVIIRAEK